MKIRLTQLCGSLVESGRDGRLYKAGMVYDCGEKEAKLRLARGEAEPYIEGEPDYVPPEGTAAHITVTKAIREQGTVIQPKRRQLTA